MVDAVNQLSEAPILKEMLAAMKNLQTYVHGLETEVRGVGTEVHGVGTKVEGVQFTMETLCTSFVEMKQEMVSLKAENAETKQRVEDLEDRIRTLEDSQLRSMEHTFDNYLIFKGIVEEQNETNGILKAKINSSIREKAERDIPCTTAYRLGRSMHGARPVRAYWVDKSMRDTVLRNSKTLLPIKVTKDLPPPLRKVQMKIRAKGFELRNKGEKFEYRDLGLHVNGNFVHHSDIELADQESPQMDAQ
jgi:hypothetical protein